jgi:hypothetical protein
LRHTLSNSKNFPALSDGDEWISANNNRCIYYIAYIYIFYIIIFELIGTISEFKFHYFIEKLEKLFRAQGYRLEFSV